jgi:hypothetical protein
LTYLVLTHSKPIGVLFCANYGTRTTLARFLLGVSIGTVR